MTKLFPGSASERAKALASKVFSASNSTIRGARDVVVASRSSLKTLTAKIVANPTSTEEVSKKYALAEELGKGQFGVTRRAKNKESGEEVAVKSIFKRNIVSKSDVDDIKREIAITRLVAGHEGIVGIKGVFEDKHHVHLVLELCRGGDFLKRVVARRLYSEQDAARYMQLIMEAVAFCHEQGIVHRDLKPDNFLMVDEGDDSAIKLTDFGLAVHWTKGSPPLKDQVGSAFYMAPEVLAGEYGSECDVWSCGIILFVLLSGQPPFNGQTKEQVQKAIQKAKLDFSLDPWTEVSDAAKELITAMLNPDPKERITAEEVLKNPWVQGKAAPKAPMNTEVTRRIGSFSGANNMTKVALKVIACGLSRQEILGLKELFKKMDKDKSGAITFEELKEGLKQSGSKLSEADIQKMWDVADVDENNTIDYTEFITATMQINKAQSEENIFAAFQHFDKDGSGQITVSELKAALIKENMFDEDELDAIIKEVDTDGNGVIDYDEFFAMMKGTPTEYQT